MVKHMQCSIWCNPRSLLHSDTRINTLTQTGSWGGKYITIYWAYLWSAAKEELVLWTCRRTSGFCTAWQLGWIKSGWTPCSSVKSHSFSKKKKKIISPKLTRQVILPEESSCWDVWDFILIKAEKFNRAPQKPQHAVLITGWLLFRIA